MRKTALVDCDGILSDFVGGVLRLVHEETGVQLSLLDFPAVWDFLKYLPCVLGARHVVKPDEVAKRVMARILEKDFVTNLDTLPGAEEGISELRDHMDVVIVTSPFFSSPFWVYERTKWLQEHFDVKAKHVIHSSEKHRIHGDLFLDDKPGHVLAWAEQWGHRTPACSPALLWSTYLNRGNTDPLRRVESWVDLLAIAQA